MRTLSVLGCICCAGLVGCGDDSGSSAPWGPLPDGATVDLDASTSDAGSGEGGTEGGSAGAGGSDGGEETDAITPDKTVAVSHAREVRGAWIATVSRINWPSSSDGSAQKTEMIAILDAVKKAGLNTVFFQVRPEADALYASSIEPWSRYLTGTQGQDPGYDPLSFVVDAGHSRGIEVHAWLNPYRAKAGNVGACAANHVVNKMPEAVVTYGDLEWLDPGHPGAFDHTLSVIEDLLKRYDIDGIHFDDYFYPYPKDGMAFDDDATYSAYGGGMSRDDWRRDNVNRMVAAVGESVKSLRTDVRWGISPFGIYRPGMPSGVVGLDQYEELYADPLKWMQEGWLEYVAPQLYWPTTSSGQPYGKLLQWWDARAAETGRMLLVGNSASGGFSLDEYRAEMDTVRGAASSATRGAIWWSVGPIVDNANGLATMLKAEYYGRPAATPAILGAADTPPAHPQVQVTGGVAQILTESNGIRFWAVYREDAGAWQIDRLVPSATQQITITQGQWAISAIDRSGRESLGVVVQGEGTAADAGPSGASCVHSYGGVYADGGCSPSYQCCDGKWLSKGSCGACTCQEDTGKVGCGT